MQLTILASLALLAMGVSAGEGVHLANCLQSSPLGDIPYSRMMYYADDKQANLNGMSLLLFLGAICSRGGDFAPDTH
jgi:hypothetical protein